jgi:hypothetical protein
MKKLSLLLAVLFALSIFTFAQKDKDKDKDRDRDQNRATATDNIQITSGPQVTNQSGNTATLTWTTSGVAANEVKYGNNPNNLNQTAYDREGSTQHNIQLTNLQPGETVYFEILRRNGSARDRGKFQFTGNGSASVAMNPSEFPSIGTTTTSMPGMPTTPGAPSTAGVGIGGIHVEQISSGPIARPLGNGSVQIAWTTSVAGDSNVMYGSTPGSMQQLATGPGNTTNHVVTISGLQRGQQYFFSTRTTKTGDPNTVIQSNTSGFVAQ